MTNYSRTTLRELKKRYLNILKKCLLANLLAFSFMLPAGAEVEINPSEYIKSTYGTENGLKEKYFKFIENITNNYELHIVEDKKFSDFTVSYAPHDYTYATQRIVNNLKDSIIINKVFEDISIENESAIYTINENIENYDKIVADFIDNNSRTNGSALRIHNIKYLDTVIGTFIGNSNTFYGSKGGAIALYSSSVGTIKGDFVYNSSNGAISEKDSSVINSYGGAIYNDANSSINKIQGNFIGNSITLKGQGAAIRNNGGTIKNINANFIGNFVNAPLGGGFGGAFSSNGIIGTRDSQGNLQGGFINSNFYGNYIITEDPRGAAIYTTKSLNIIADKGTSTFKENYVQVGSNQKDYQAIYVNSADAVLTFDSRNGGEIFMYDNVNGADGYKVHITGDKTGKMHLYNDIKNATALVSNTTLDIGIHKVNVKDITFEKGANLAVTINDLKNYGSLIAEKITVAEDAKTNATLTLGLSSLPKEGVYKIFESNTDLKLVTTHDFFDITDLENGSYKIARKKTDELAEKFGLNEEETRAVSAVIGGNSENEAFQKVQTEIMETLKSGNKGKAKKALSGVGAKEQPVEQSVASEHLVALQNVVQAELHGAGVGRAGGEEDPRAKVYIKGLYDRTKSSMGEGFRARSKGAVLGVQSEVTDTLTLGVGYATSQTTAKEDLRRTEVDTNTGFISAHYQPNAWWVSGLATFSRGEYEEEKQILSSTGKASYDVDSWGAQVMTGYDIKLETAIITPEVGMRYLSVKQEGYTDTLGTTVSGTRSDYLTALVGMKGTWDMGAIRPTAGVTVGYDIISDDVSALNTLANGASYTVNGEALDRLSTTLTTGIEADLGERTTLKLEYSGTYRKEYVDHSGMLRLEMKF